MPPGLDDEVAFISNVKADGTLALYSYDAWNPGTIPADYSGGSTNAEKWGGITAGTPGGTVYYYFNPASNWSSTEQSVLAAGLALWSDIANISFALTADSTQAQIKFTRGSNGGASTSHQAVDTSPGRTAGDTGGTYLFHLTSATISIDTSVAGFGPISNNFSTYGGYPIDSLLHEEGHAIGLGHAGPYNSTVNPATQQFSAYDTRLWGIMSYIEPRTTTAAYYSQYPVTGTVWGGNDPTTWMPLDIIAAQALYGLPTSTPLSGGQTFGFNCNIQGPSEMFFDFTKNTNPVITIWDMGTNNTLDISGFSTSSRINLNPGTFSSCDGLTNNICIAFNTAIDRFVGGSGNDTVTANNDGDTLIGGLGNNTLIGGAGFDRAVYSGNYAAYTITYNSNGSVTIAGLGLTDTLANIEEADFTDQALALGNSLASISIGNASVIEGGVLHFGVTLDQAAAQNITLGYDTFFGTASMADSDYLGGMGTLTIQAGQTTGTINIQTVQDGQVEPDETMSVHLLTTNLGNITQGIGTGTILSNSSMTPPFGAYSNSLTATLAGIS